MTVNGTEWTTKEPIDQGTYIYAWADSPEIIVNDSGIDNVSADGKDAPANVYNLQGIEVKRDATDLGGLPSGLYIIGGKKVLVK